MPTTTSTTTKSLFDKLGGKTAVETVVNEFYKRVLNDDQLKPYFAKTDVVKLKRHQVNFVTQALGGPKQYTGRSMKRAHETLKVTGPHFDRVAGHLSGALKWAGVAQGDVDQVIGAVAPLKPEIVAA